MRDKLETIKDLIEAQGGPLEGDLHGSNLEEVYKLVLELLEEENMEGLIEGRIVHYVAFNGRHLMAGVVGIEEGGKVDLVVFTNMLNVNGMKNFGMQFHQDILHSETKEPGTWHWIEQA